MVPLVVRYGHLLCMRKGVDDSYLCIWVCWICVDPVRMCCCSGYFCCTWCTRVHCSVWLCSFLCCDLRVCRLSILAFPSICPNLWDVPESLAALELLSWLLDLWCLLAMFLHLLLFRGLSLRQAGRMFSMFVLLFTCAICVSHYWTSSKVLVLCRSLLSKFTVWCVLSEFWPIFALACGGLVCFPVTCATVPPCVVIRDV